jgi:hypothetical protein
MLEWKSRLVVLLVAAAVLATALADNHGWFLANHGW